MKAEEREAWVGESRFYLGEDNIMYETIVGDFDEELALKGREIALKIIGSIPGKLHRLIDLNRCGKPSPGARKVGKELFEHENTGKVAMYGLHPVARVIASFMIGVSKKKDIHFFKSKEEALAWLKE